MINQSITVYQAMRHFYSFWFHRVLLAKLILRNAFVVQITDFHCNEVANSSIYNGEQFNTLQYCPIMLSVYLFFSLFLPTLSQNCIDKPSCFVKKLFDFSFPKQGFYQINITQSITQATIKAYGDFNNDLITDFVAIGSANNILIYIFDSTTSLFSLQYEIAPTQCTVQRLYLYDINNDDLLDIAVWGVQSQGNCLTALLQSPTHQFIQQPTNYLTNTPTTDPILITLPPTHQTKGFFLYDQARVILTYTAQGYQTLDYSTLFIGPPNWQSVSFLSPHWNSFLDVNGDCIADLVLTNTLNQLQIWINNMTVYNFQQTIQFNYTLNSLTFGDFNYDGAIDLLTITNTINLYFNVHQVPITATFCQDTVPFELNFSAPRTTTLPQGMKALPQMVKTADIDIDGYLDILLILYNAEQQSPYIPYLYRNTIGQQLPFTPFQNYNSILSSALANVEVTSVSVMDILQNGIMDVMVVGASAPSSPPTLYVFYNNYLFSNSYFLKGYALSTQTTAGDAVKGVPDLGVSFYWINSIGNTERVALLTQSIQCAYDALATPYALSGVGKANNYIDKFTVGSRAMRKAWSPIIPNSQMAIFQPSTQKNQWRIKVFVTPTQSLIYVIIVSLFTLAVLGAVLLYFKCKKTTEKKSPLLGAV